MFIKVNKLILCASVWECLSSGKISKQFSWTWKFWNFHRRPALNTLKCYFSRSSFKKFSKKLEKVYNLSTPVWQENWFWKKSGKIFSLLRRITVRLLAKKMYLHQSMQSASLKRITSSLEHKNESQMITLNGTFLSSWCRVGLAISGCNTAALLITFVYDLNANFFFWI